MPVYKPTELIKYMQELETRAKKKLSQNFLIDGNIIHKIVELSGLGEQELVLEIGPGPGALTEALLNAGASVVAVEKDSTFAEGLKRLQGDKPLEIYCNDILEFPLENLLKKSGKKAKVVANLPYHITTPILAKLAPRVDLFSEIIIMVQDEVARRFTAKPGTKEYSSFTLFLDFYSSVQYGFKVSHNCFHPKPGVDSAMIKMTLHEPPENVDPEQFFKLTRTAFGQRRKTLSKTLKTLYPASAIKEALESIQKSPLCRPEELSLEEFIVIYHKLSSKVIV